MKSKLLIKEKILCNFFSSFFLPFSLPLFSSLFSSILLFLFSVLFFSSFFCSIQASLDLFCCLFRSVGLFHTIPFFCQSFHFLIFFIISFVDAGGQRGERKKWKNLFDKHYSLILYISSISDFDEVLREDSSQNRMEESLQLWDLICSSNFFR